MAYEYRLPVIDIDGAIKAVQDNAFRQEQLRLKYEESMNKSIDDEERRYSGKVRKQDVGEFGSIFAEYAETKKAYQALNRRSGRGGDLTAASEAMIAAKRNMDTYITESAGLGQTQIGLGKIFKDPTKLVNTKKFNETYMQMSSMTTNEIKQLYGGDLSKLPTDFEFREEDFDQKKVNALSTSVKNRLPIKSANAIKEIPSINQATGQQNTVKRDINLLGKNVSVNVPLVRVSVGAPAEAVLNAVISSTANDDEAMNYMKLYQKKVNERLADTSNPQVQKEAEALLNKTMDVFGITDRSQVNQYHLFASDYIDKSRVGDIEIEDWSGLEDQVDILLKQNRLSLQNIQKQKLLNDIKNSNSEMSVKSFNQVITMFNNLSNSGLLVKDDYLNTAAGLLKRFNLPLDRQLVTDANAEKYRQQQRTTESIYDTPVPSAFDRK